MILKIKDALSNITRPKKYYLRHLIFYVTAFVVCLITGSKVFSQVTISGTVYDITKRNPVEAVSVISTSGRGTTTDSLGRYSIEVREKDSIYFSFLNKPTAKYAVLKIQNPDAFDIAIQRKIQELPGVTIRTRNYKLDSIQNRRDYEKVFNFEKPGIKTSLNPSPGGVSAGLDLESLINMFSFRKNRSMLAFQKRLVQDEEDKYVNHRFSKNYIRKLTGLTSPELDSFIVAYSPPFTLVNQLNDLELGQFIIEAYKLYKAGVPLPAPRLKPKEEE